MADMQGVILAGGTSSRMMFPKALMPIGDSFFLLAIYQNLVDAGIAPVHMVINTGLRTSLEAQMGKFPNGAFVFNDKPIKGQIYSLQLGLKAAQAAGAGSALVALVDHPGVRPETVSALLQRAAASPGKVVVPTFEGQNGHPIIVPKERFDAFISCPEGKTARDVIQENASWVECVDVSDRGVVTDIDTPEDLAKLTALSDEID